MFEYDSNLVFISLELSRKLLLFEDNSYNRLEFYLYDPLQVKKFKNLLNQIIKNK